MSIPKENSAPVAKSASAKKMLMGDLMQTVGILPILILIVAVFGFIAPNFFTESNLLNITRQASINIVLAAGMTFIILTGGIDLSVGSILGTTAVAAMVVSLIPEFALLSIPAALMLGLLLGLFNGALVAFAGLPPFIVTLGTYTALRGAAYLLADGTTVINSDISFEWIGNDYLGPVPWLVVIALAVIAMCWFILRRTTLGVHIYAVGGNMQAARLTGIKVWLVLLFVYGMSGLLSGLGGVMSASRLYSANGNLGVGYELDAIAAVILGGTSFVGGIGTITGTLVGALIIATLNNGMTLMGGLLLLATGDQRGGDHHCGADRQIPYPTSSKCITTTSYLRGKANAFKTDSHRAVCWRAAGRLPFCVGQRAESDWRDGGRPCQPVLCTDHQRGGAGGPQTGGG
ncbi:ribose ABC transporter permease RbsC [Klebsiella pneumoniae]|uniref:Ribose ABC transporter permease RbsC n=3 Tax=Enterobacteriaceae TaxID=543 RepID=A0A3S4KJD2_KLEPN|nr:ribose ABC transporter permease RbsC [Klebsiella pneumoniae]